MLTIEKKQNKNSFEHFLYYFNPCLKLPNIYYLTVNMKCLMKLRNNFKVFSALVSSANPSILWCIRNMYIYTQKHIWMSANGSLMYRYTATSVHNYHTYSQSNIIASIRISFNRVFFYFISALRLRNPLPRVYRIEHAINGRSTELRLNSYINWAPASSARYGRACGIIPHR